MEQEQLVQICKNRNELDFLYKLTKIVAEADSIGEGHSYCDTYTRENFDSSIFDGEWVRGMYIEEAGLPLYEAYLKHLGVCS